MGPFLLTFLYFIAAIVIILIGVVLFELLTRKYKDWDEIKSGNYAVALSISGKILAISIILAFSIYHNDTIFQTIVWGAYGIALQIIAYLLFEMLTRNFSVEEELKNRNVAVGLITFSVSVGLAFVIGTSIT